MQIEHVGPTLAKLAAVYKMFCVCDPEFACVFERLTCEKDNE